MTISVVRMEMLATMEEHFANPHSNFQQTIQSLREASATEEGTIEAQLGCGSVQEPRTQKHLCIQTKGIL